MYVIISVPERLGNYVYTILYDILKFDQMTMLFKSSHECLSKTDCMSEDKIHCMCTAPLATYLTKYDLSRASNCTSYV